MYIYIYMEVKVRRKCEKRVLFLSFTKLESCLETDFLFCQGM